MEQSEIQNRGRKLKSLLYIEPINRLNRAERVRKNSLPAIISTNEPSFIESN